MAIAGASVIAITPVVASPPTPTRVVEAQTALMGATYTQLQSMNQGQLVFEFGVRVAEQFAQAPLLPLVLAAQVGEKNRLYEQVRQIIDAPLYVSDPLIELVRDSGGGEEVKVWRDTEFWAATNAARTQIAEALGVDPTLDANYAFKLAQGLLESGFRFAELPVLQASSLITLAQAVDSGSKVDIYKVVRDYIDGPQWAIDPAIEGIAQALPKSLGGGSDGVFNDQKDEDGAIMRFRNKEMLGVRNAVRVAAADVLGVDVKPDGNLPDPDLADNQSQRTTLQAAAPEAGKRDVSNLKPHVTSLNAKIKKSIDGARDRAEKRRETVRANVQTAVNNARTAASNFTKKVTPKKESNTESKSESKGSED
ncbi:hypothetical protein A5740_04605 [Mycobacterium sp. GA-1841]|uniref:hypothetical protein n=1 Tax=Mycobacterium sp. GA-1841 TaxID=1834154 RepID=UPI0009701343|nr:hypothetical protein [Mycobacterium sp. GA-1841]OMC37531.1 hypothetical protein A5740_04605 [Mycobacterium sp. GA-1841]